MKEVSMDCLNREDIKVLLDVMECTIEMAQDFESDDESFFTFTVKRMKETQNKIHTFYKKMEK
jgi:hypothetical protein